MFLPRPMHAMGFLITEIRHVRLLNLAQNVCVVVRGQVSKQVN